MRDPETYLISRLRFRHLSVVEALDQLRSIRKAAHRLHLSEPAVSKALGEIETSFGFRLFNRSAAGVVPTPQGSSVIEGATLLLNSLRHVRRSAAAVGNGIILRLGSVPFLGMSVLPQLLSVLKARGSQLRVQLREATSPELLEMLHKGEIDAMLTTLSPELVKPGSGVELAFRPLFTETLVVLAPPGSPLTRKRQIDLADLSREPWILPPVSTVTTVAIRDAFLSKGVAPPTPWIESSGVHSSIEFVAAGLGLCAAPMALARASRRRGLVAELKVNQPIALPPVCFMHRVAESQSQAMTILSGALEDMDWVR